MIDKNSENKKPTPRKKKSKRLSLSTLGLLLSMIGLLAAVLNFREISIFQPSVMETSTASILTLQPTMPFYPTQTPPVMATSAALPSPTPQIAYTQDINGIARQLSEISSRVTNVEDELSIVSGYSLNNQMVSLELSHTEEKMEMQNKSLQDNIISIEQSIADANSRIDKIFIYLSGAFLSLILSFIAFTRKEKK
jgi:hypothetical protein